MEESQIDDEGKERDECRSSTEPNTRRRIATKTSLEENKSDETTVAVQEDCEHRRFGDRQQHSKMVPVQEEQRVTGQGKPTSL